MRRVIVADTTCLVGFRWLLKEKRSRAEISAEAGEEYDRLVVIPGQYGLIQTQKSSEKAVSLAALLRDADAESVSVYTLRDTDGELFYWVLGVRHDRISSRTDKDFQSEAEALSFADSVKDSLGLDGVKIHTQEESLSRVQDVLAGASKSALRTAGAVSLHQVTRTRVIKTGLAALVFFGLCWGIHLSMNYYHQVQRAEAGRASMARKEARIADVQAHPERHFVNEWMTAPRPGDFLLSAVPAMLRHPLAANGWRLKALSCGKTLRATWEQTPFAEYTRLPFNAVLDEKSPQLAHSSQVLMDAGVSHPIARSVDTLLSQEQAVRRLYGFTHHFALKNRITFNKREVKKVENQVVLCPWISATWELSSLPAYLIADFPSMARALDIPGLVITEVSYSDNIWKLKGELYAK